MHKLLLLSIYNLKKLFCCNKKKFRSIFYQRYKEMTPFQYGEECRFLIKNNIINNLNKTV